MCAELRSTEGVCVCGRRGRDSLFIAICLEPSDGNTGAAAADVRSRLPCPCSFPGNARCSCWQRETSLGHLLNTLPIHITFPLISSSLLFLFKSTPPSLLVAVKVRRGLSVSPSLLFSQGFNAGKEQGGCVWGHPNGCRGPCSCD